MYSCGKWKPCPLYINPLSVCQFRSSSRIKGIVFAFIAELSFFFKPLPPSGPLDRIPDQRRFSLCCGVSSCV